MPILNSAFTRSAPFSAMRLASSWTVIAFGHDDVAHLLFARPDDDPPCERFSFSRARLSAARLRARRLRPSLSARVTVSLPDWRRSVDRRSALFVTSAPGARVPGAWAGTSTGVKRRGGGTASVIVARGAAVSVQVQVGGRRSATGFGSRRCSSGIDGRRSAAFGLGTAIFFGAAAFLFLAHSAGFGLFAAARFFERAACALPRPHAAVAACRS